MNADELERQIRATLDENVHGIIASRFPRPDLLSAANESRPTEHRWLVPAVAAAIVLAIVTIGGLVSMSGNHRNGTPVMAAGEILDGAWQLVGATSGGHQLGLRPGWIVTLTVPNNDTIRINDGVNTTDLSGHGANGSLHAQFRSVTYVLDPRSSDTDGRALLHLLDSIAPSSDPAAITNTSYQVANDQLSIQTSAGELRFKQLTPVRPTDPAGTSTTAGAGQPS